jgi:hypothetical protein
MLGPTNPSVRFQDRWARLSLSVCFAAEPLPSPEQQVFHPQPS